jgi:tRNA pseudouridine65 synthase
MLSIIYHDTALVVINKPSGLLVHRSMIDRHETAFAMQMVRDQIGQHVFPIHRLDKPTSGILVFALSSAVAQQVNQQLTAQHWHKEYTAIVRGWAQPQLIDYALKEKLDKIADKQAQVDKPAQEAVTRLLSAQHFLVPEPVGRYQQARLSQVQLAPITGRKHQLRRHLAHVNHPIVGDTTHGDGKQNAFMRQHFGLQRLALHHHRLRMQHPLTGGELCLEAPLTEDMTTIIDSLQSYRVNTN